MLRRPEGATVEEVATARVAATHGPGPLFRHTEEEARAHLASAREERGRVYRIAAPEQA